MWTTRECYICGKQGDLERHHMLHGSMRQLAEEDGLVVWLCSYCHRRLHDHGKFDRELQAEAQRRWMVANNATEEDFIKRYGRGYL